MLEAVLLLSLATPSPAIELRAAVHVHTTFSDGDHSIQEIAEMARNAGVHVVVLSDHFMDEISYGLPLLRDAASMTLHVPSLTPQRMSSYLDATREAEEQTGVLILPGVELTPYYYWEGSPVSGDFTLRSADRHMLVVFPDRADPEALADALPTVSSPGGRRYGFGSILLLWPLIPLAWAFSRLLSPPLRSVRTRYFLIERRERGPMAWIAAGVSIAALVLSWPFTVPRFSPYTEGGAGLAPYQYAADEAARVGALSFWPHPESTVEYRHARYPVNYRSDRYPHFVSRVEGVTGFASLFEGYRETAAPGGPWDEALHEFRRGDRSRPVWTLAELSIHRQGEAGGKRIGQVETVLRVRERSRDGVLEALASGSGYAVRHAPESRLLLEDFTVTSGGRSGRGGERIPSAGEQRIEVRLRREGESTAPVTLRVIRDGAVIRSEEREIASQGSSFLWVDRAPIEDVSYYRIVVEGSYPEMLLSNPVFVFQREGAS